MYDTFKLHLNLPWSMSTDTMYIVAAEIIQKQDEFKVYILTSSS